MANLTSVKIISPHASGEVMDYFALMKPRVMSLVLFTAFVGLVLAPGDIHPLTAFTALLCVGVGAGASGALNMWYDADIDAVMQRTARRPIPRGLITPHEALAFGSVLAGGSILVMGVLVNWMASGLLMLTIIYYVFIYTMWLKRRTPQNIVIGGAAGAFPPMIGWAAVTGAVSLESVALFLIIFAWTPPHFWALALVRKDDYDLAGIPMLPNVAGEDETRKQILIYAIIASVTGLVPVALGLGGILYALVSGSLGVMFILAALRVYQRRDVDAGRKAAHSLFKFSIIYLFAIFATLAFERLAAIIAGSFGMI
jgi:protoheme IX farnesyltransferase